MKIDFNQPITFKPIAEKGFSFYSNTVVVVSLISLIISASLLVNTLSQLGRQPQDITASQLLNQNTIDQAIDHLENQTVNFSLE